MVKGKLKSEAGLFLLLVNGHETTVDQEGSFTARVRLKFLDKEIPIKTIDKEKQVTEIIIKVYRPFSDGEEITTSFERHGQDYALLIATDEYDSWGT